MTDVPNTRARPELNRHLRVFEARHPATLADVSCIRAALCQRLAERRLPRATAEDLSLAFSEIAGNVIEHGRPAANFLGVTVDLVGEGVFLEVTDDGGGIGSLFDHLKEARASGLDLDEAGEFRPAVMRLALDRFRYHAGEVNRFLGWKSLKGSQIVAFDEASHAVDALYQATFGDGARVVGVIGAKSGDGVSACARSLARRCALTKRRTLLLDISGSSQDDGSSAEHILLHRDGYEVVTLHPRGDDLFRYRSQDALRQLMTHSFDRYQAIVVDCAPTSTGAADPVPGHIVARCADAVLLVCLGGKTTRQALSDAKRALAGANVLGVVVNRRDQVTLGEELARQAMRSSKFFPSLARKLAGQLIRSRFLDVHI